MDNIEYVLLALSVLSLVLHFIAPRTATTVDDEAAKAVDAVKDGLKKKP
jgi:hypothetical protein